MTNARQRNAPNILFLTVGSLGVLGEGNAAILQWTNTVDKTLIKEYNDFYHQCKKIK
jgi:hypothetical protein